MAGIKIPSRGGWKVASLFMIVAITLPILFVVSNALSIDSDHWQTTLLPLYAKNTFILLLGVSALSLIIGISTAWIVTIYDFPFRKQFEWILILPLSIPTFINAIAYVGLTDYAGPIRIFLRFVNLDAYFDIMDHTGAIFVMSLVLYPYVYVASRTAFLLQSASLIEVSRSLGKSLSQTFLKISLPIAWPAIFTGLILVIMEVLNDYGVVQYFGIPTFTIGIFKSWLALGDFKTAVFLSLIVLLFIISLIAIDSFFQRKKRLSSEKEDQVFSRISHSKKWLPFFICLIPVLLGFLIPVGQMIWWAVLASSKDIWISSFLFLKNTAILGFISGVVVVTIAIILSYTHRISSKNFFNSIFFKIPMLGYAIPGAVIGIGIVGFIVSVNPNWIYSGIIALIFGYTTRFFAVGQGPLDSGLKKISTQLDLAASSLGKNAFERLIKIHIPILKPALVGAFIMVFVDVAKELPLTLILRPFNFETLGTNAFQYAKDEMAPKSASSSLLIIFVSAIPVYFLNKLLNKKSA